ncbi:U-box domain-containing protein 9-like [Typha latifolia]|uniref:U-box domain-containing protein 9-like n=1 Tax=Typha latifolia TaxID=4733 RepID=UPI003C2B6974
MAKSEAGEAAACAAELRRELRRLVRVISDDAGAAAETYEEAAVALAALRDLKFGSSNGRRGSSFSKERRKEESVQIPVHFLCPISSEIMRDPVVLASGQTYDRPFIQEWLNSGNRTCPQTQHVLSNTTLTPNHLVRSMISEWCIEHNITLPSLDNQEECLVTKNERSAFSQLLEKISSSSSIVEQKQGVRELRLLTKRNRSFRAIIGDKPDSISELLSVLSVPGLHGDLEVQEDMVTTILNLSIHDSNKKIVGDNPKAIPLLIEALKSGTMEARSNSAAALFTLSSHDTNKLKIGEMGAMKHLVDLLELGSPNAKKDAASAIFNLCMAHENRARAVQEGVVNVALKAIVDQSLVDESLAILALLSSDQEAVEEISEGDGLPCVLHIIRESSCGRNKENAVVILFSICMYDRTKLKEVGDDEKMNGKISWLAQNGTSRAQRKASGILEKLRRTMHNKHYSC